MLTREEKKKIIDIFGRHPKDAGSPEVQISILTERIKRLTEHFKKHPKDYASKRDFMVLVARRRKLLKYLKKENRERYEWLINKLGIRGV